MWKTWRPDLLDPCELGQETHHRRNQGKDINKRIQETCYLGDQVPSHQSVPREGNQRLFVLDTGRWLNCWLGMHRPGASKFLTLNSVTISETVQPSVLNSDCTLGKTKGNAQDFSPADERKKKSNFFALENPRERQSSLLTFGSLDTLPGLSRGRGWAV